MICRLVVLVAAVAYTSVTSALPPCICTREMKPVCGTDGDTYNNMCLLRCQQQSNPSLELQSRGRCRETNNEETCMCSFDYNPVCGSDGRTYHNKCAMDCDSKNRGNVVMVHRGECRPKREVAAESMCLCPYNYAPVCGSDGKTYNNMCLLRCQQQSNPSLDLQSQGRCRSVRETRYGETCICTPEYNPVCGSDGRTYANMCALYCNPENRGYIGKVHEGECRNAGKAKREVAAERMCLCPYNYLPVCGSDGKTYGNECSLKCEDNVEVAYQGVCKDKREVENEGPACFCTFENDPVCGSNGKTYDNMCALECEGETVQLAYKGECKVKRESVNIAELAPCVCTRETKPVCGTDGQTYSNACLLNCISKQREDLHILHPGRCHEVHVREVNLNAHPACTCTRNLQPVCASDGRTYSNECIMRCSGNDLTVQSDGPCNDSGWPKPNYSISD